MIERLCERWAKVSRKVKYILMKDWIIERWTNNLRKIILFSRRIVILLKKNIDQNLFIFRNIILI